MISYRDSNGFTVVELLVAIVIAVLLMGAGAQAYSAALTNAGTAQRRAKASNMAYDLLRQAQASLTTPCSASGPTSVTLPDTTALPGATAVQTVACPFSASSTNLSLVTITVTYNNTEQGSVTRAIVFAP